MGLEEAKMSGNASGGATDRQNQHAAESEPTHDLHNARIGVEREERLVALALLHQRRAENFQAALLNSYQYAPASHPCVQQLATTVRWAAEQIGMDPDTVSIHVFKRYPYSGLELADSQSTLEEHLPEAFVLPRTGAIFVNVQLLEGLSWSSPLVNAVLYHEVAHMQFKKRLLEEVGLSIDDPIKSRSNPYEVEYHCDRFATLLSSLRGEDPRSIGLALQALEDARRRMIERSKLPNNKVTGSDPVFLSTHPTTLRRIRANTLIARNLPHFGGSSGSTLEEVSDAEMPVGRPFGNIVRGQSSIGLDNKIISDKVIDPPQELATLLTTAHALESSGGDQSKSVLFSDWFANLHYFLVQETGSEFGKEFAAELRGLPHLPPPTQDELREVLEMINIARLLENDTFTDLQSAHSVSERDLAHSVDLLVARYIEMARQQHSPLEVLDELVRIGHHGDRHFGVGIVFCGHEIARLCVEIATRGSDEEKEGLVNLVDSSPHLLSCIELLERKESHALQALIKERSKTTIHFSKETLLEVTLRQHTLQTWLGPALSSRDPCKLPICVRREPGSAFRVERQTLRNGREYELVIIGDRPPGDLEEAMLAAHLNRVVNEGLERLALRHDRPLKDYFASRQAYTTEMPTRISDIRKAAQDLLAMKPKTAQEKREYFSSSFAQHFRAEVDNQTRKAEDIAALASRDDLIDIQFITDLELRVRLEGEKPVQHDLIGNNRSSFSQARYAQTEERSVLNIQHETLWRELYGETYASIPAGLPKAQFLVSTYPVKTLYRDQLLCESLGLPPLEYLDDIKAFSQSIQEEGSLDVLLLLRDSFRNHGLAQIVEGRLFDLFTKQPAEFLNHNAILQSRAKLLKPLPDLVQSLVVSEDRLLGILACFTHASRERDRHLVEFRDRANDRAQKEALGVLFSDPNLASTSGKVSFQARQLTDGVSSFLKHLSPYDRAQALLYLMGHRSFNSPIENWFREKRGGFSEEFADLLARQNSRNYEMPDVIVRAQKIFGMGVETAQNLRAGLLSERTITDLLDEAICGTEGITSSPRVAKQFFQVAGRVLIREDPQLAALSSAQQRKIEKFVTFAFEQCPSSRLASVILKVWEASKGDKKGMPALAANILAKLGPAFVKFGQRLSTLNIDEEYKRAFRKLCSENAQVDTSFIYHNLRVLCGSETFDELRTGRKIAEGSMAATFQGVLRRSGEEVAVKVIHPYIKDDVEEDVQYIEKLVRYLNEKRPFARLMVPQNTPEIIRYQLNTQADSALEMERANQLQSALRPQTAVARFAVPEVKRQDSGNGVIVFSFMPSYELDNPEIDRQRFDAQAIRNDVGLEVLRMLLEERYFQSDVNLGNFGVRKDARTGAILRDPKGLPTVVWYDPGAVEQIESEDQKLLLKVIKAAMQAPQEIPELVSRMVQGAEEQKDDVRRVCNEFGQRLKSAGAISLTHIQDQFNKFFDDLSRIGCIVQDKWVVIANTLSMAAPLLKGVSEKQVTELVVNAMSKHELLSAKEKFGLRLAALWK